MRRFPFDKATQKYGSPCKACHAAAAKAFRASPQHAERLRQQERARSAARSVYIRAWHADHPEARRAAVARHYQRRALGQPVGAPDPAGG